MSVAKNAASLPMIASGPEKPHWHSVKLNVSCYNQLTCGTSILDPEPTLKSKLALGVGLDLPTLELPFEKKLRACLISVCLVEACVVAIRTREQR